MPMLSGSKSPLRRAMADLRDCLVSLKLTIVLLMLSMILIFAATLDQVNLGIWAVQEKYFRSFVIYTQVGKVLLPVFPGGYTIGGLLLANLIAAHVCRFAFTWRKLGIQIIHLGLIVLLIGELLTGLLQEDYHLRLIEGETKRYAESFRLHELAISTSGGETHDDVVAVPEALLLRKAPVQHHRLPFRITTKAYYPNSSLHVRAAEGANGAGTGEVGPVIGVGGHVMASPQPITYHPDERNIPSAFIELVGSAGPIGTYLVSAHLPQPQTFQHEGRTWQISLRVKRAYHPFSLTLLKFSHDRYAGTEIPKNFSSRLRLASEDGAESREVLIYMNNPLRHAGLTFYQAGFENDDRTTVLQVVRNPSWLVPYVACALMTAGLMIQFGLHLCRFVRRPRSLVGDPAATPEATRPLIEQTT